LYEKGETAEDGFKPKDLSGLQENILRTVTKVERYHDEYK